MCARLSNEALMFTRHAKFRKTRSSILHLLSPRFHPLRANFVTFSVKSRVEDFFLRSKRNRNQESCRLKWRKWRWIFSNCLQRVGWNKCAVNLSDSLVVFFVKWHVFTLSMTSGKFDRFFHDTWNRSWQNSSTGTTYKSLTMWLFQSTFLSASIACSTRNRMIVSKLLSFYVRAKRDESILS